MPLKLVRDAMTEQDADKAREQTMMLVWLESLPPRLSTALSTVIGELEALDFDDQLMLESVFAEIYRDPRFAEKALDIIG